MVCTTIEVGGGQTQDFIISADVLNGGGAPFTATISISYPPGANTEVGLQDAGLFQTECFVRVPLDANGQGSAQVQITGDIDIKGVLNPGLGCCAVQTPIICGYSNVLKFTIGGLEWETMALLAAGILGAAYVFGGRRD